MTTILRSLIAGLAIAMLASPALAHSTVKNTTPVSGSVMPESPDHISVTFNQEARLTSLVVVEEGKTNRKLKFSPQGSAKTFTAHEPMLASGRNEVQWKALSKDGHPIEGTIIIIVEPGAKPSAPDTGAVDHSHH